MNRYLKISLLALCGFASIQASQISPSEQNAHQDINYSKFDNVRSRATNAYGIRMARSISRLPHSRASILLQAASLGLVAYFGKAAIDQYKIYNKSQADNLQIQKDNQKMTAGQYKISNTHTEQQIQNSQTANNIGKIGLGMQTGGAAGAVAGSLIAPGPGTVIGGGLGLLVGGGATRQLILMHPLLEKRAQHLFLQD